MFCVQCGAELPDGSKFCCNCGYKLQTDIIQKSDRSIVSNDAYKNVDLSYVSKIYNDIYKMAEKESESFVSGMDRVYSNLDTFMKKGASDISNLFVHVEEYTVSILQKKGIYHYGIDEVRQFTRKYMGYSLDVLIHLGIAYENAIEKGQKALAYSNYLKNNRVYLVGGGFGVSGAIKGTALASTVNATIGAFHSYAASARERVIGSELTARKNFLFHQNAFRSALSFSLELDMKESIHGICDLFSELKLGTIPFYPLENIMRAANILDAVIEGKVSKGDIEKVAYQIIDLYPVHRDMYLYAADICPKNSNMFFSMAAKYGLDIDAYYSDLDEKTRPYAKRLLSNSLARTMINHNALSTDYKKNISCLHTRLHISDYFNKRFGLCSGEMSNYRNLREKMREYFANYPDSETPILFLDASRYGDGKEGVLLTDKLFYLGGYTRSKRWSVSCLYESITFDYYKVGEVIHLKFNGLDKELEIHLTERETILFITLADFFISLSLCVKNINGIRIFSKLDESSFIKKMISLADGQVLPTENTAIENKANDSSQTCSEYNSESLVQAFDKLLISEKKRPTYYYTCQGSSFCAAIHSANKWLDRDLRIINKVYDDFNEDTEVLVFYYDPTIGGTFRESFLMTDKYFHCHSEKHGSWKIEYENIKTISVEGSIFTHISINGKSIPYVTGYDAELKELAYDLENYFIPFFNAWNKRNPKNVIEKQRSVKKSTSQNINDISNETIHSSITDMKTLCNAFLSDHGKRSFTVTSDLLLHLKVPQKEKVFLGHDDTVFHSGKNGFVVTDSGIYCREMVSNLVFTSYKDLIKAKRIYQKGSTIYADQQLIAYISMDRKVIPDLLILFRKIRDYQLRLHDS